MLIKSVRGFHPEYGDSCFIADNATLIGDVLMGEDCSVWFQAVIRGDVNSIRIGDRVNVQDGVVIHGTFEKSSTTIGDDVSIGHNALVHGCTIEDKVLIGMGSIVMDDCVIGAGSVIAAGSVLPKNTVVPRGSVYAGVPARFLKPTSKELLEEEIERIAKNYITYASWFSSE